MASDWHYIESETLHQTIAYDTVSGWMQTRDGTMYNPAELRIITKNWTENTNFPLSVHVIKKLFGGEIVAVTEKKGDTE